MSANRAQSGNAVVVGRESIVYSVVRSERKSTCLLVKPTGKVEVRSNHSRSDESLALFVRRRARWIIRQQEYFETFRPRDPERRYVSGETVRYLGRQYRLKVQEGEEAVAGLRGPHLVVTLPQLGDDQRESAGRIVRDWYKARARELLHKRMLHCLERLAPHGVAEPPLLIRWMTRRWGSCTPKGRLVLNPLLLIAPIDCVDYVVMHELCHLKHPRHDRGFYQLLDTTMPDWRVRRKRLEKCGQYVLIGDASGLQMPVG